MVAQSAALIVSLVDFHLFWSAGPDYKETIDEMRTELAAASR